MCGAEIKQADTNIWLVYSIVMFYLFVLVWKGKRYHEETAIWIMWNLAPGPQLVAWCQAGWRIQGLKNNKFDQTGELCGDQLIIKFFLLHTNIFVSYM